MQLKALVCLLFALGAARAGAQCTEGREARTIFGRRSNPEKLVKRDQTVSVGTQQDRIRYFRLELRREASSTDQGVLVVKDDNLRVVDVFRLSDLPIASPVWTRRGTGNQATLRFVVPDGQTPAVTVVRTIGMPFEADPTHTYYSLQVEGHEQYHDVYPASDGTASGSPLAKRVADSVGFLQASYEGGEQTWCCSAVAVDTDLLLTNWHCGGDASMQFERFWDDDVCRQTLIDMSWDGDRESREYQCTRVAKDRALDLALIRVRGIDGAEPLVPIRLADTEPSSGIVGLLHHPQCKRKQVTESCQIRTLGPNESAQATEFTHDCDSEGGSSGAPVFDQSGRLVGLHHAGFRREETTCKALDKVNRGIRLAELKAFITKARAELDAAVTPR
jgi:hypothetical protein